MKKISIIAIVLSAATLSLQIFIFATSGLDNNSKHTQVQRVSPVASPEIPDSLTFCGDKIPLDNFYVREALDRELTTMMYGHTNTSLIMKRAGRVFPVIEPILKKNGVPQDLKYLAVIESNLQNLTSPAKAQGYWQFMKATGQTYGLEINDDVDMRNSLESSTEAAAKFLKTLHQQFGNWPAAAAAYNCGGGGLKKRLEEQSTNSYFETHLNTETTRYVYRILAAKIIMKNPQKYGFFIRNCELYPQIPCRTVELSGKNVDLYQFAKDNKTSYKMLRMMNPWLLGNKVANKNGKTYKVKIPTEKSWGKLTKDKDRSYVNSL